MAGRIAPEDATPDGSLPDVDPGCAAGALRCNGSNAEQCKNGAWTTTDFCKVGCIEGRCAVCAGGDRRCSPDGKSVERCELGQWVRDIGCPAVCLSGACVDCLPGETSCLGLTPRQCDATGRYTSPPDCAVACQNGACTGAICTDGESRCSGSIRQKCRAGSWDSEEVCTNVCVSGECSGVCKPGSSPDRCSTTAADVIETCGPDGQWTCKTTCTNICTSGTCGGECKPGSTQCEGDDFRTCGPTGTWNGSFALCGMGCAGGACKAPTHTCGFATGLRRELATGLTASRGRVLVRSGTNGYTLVAWYPQDNTTGTVYTASFRAQEPTTAPTNASVDGSPVGSARTDTGADIFLLENATDITVRPWNGSSLGSSRTLALGASWFGSSPSNSSAGKSVVRYGDDYLLAVGVRDGSTTRLGMGRASSSTPTTFTTVTSTSQRYLEIEPQSVGTLDDVMYVLERGAIDRDVPPVLISAAIPPAGQSVSTSTIASTNLYDPDYLPNGTALWSSPAGIHVVSALVPRVLGSLTDSISSTQSALARGSSVVSVGIDADGAVLAAQEFHMAWWEQVPGSSESRVIFDVLRCALK